MLVKTAPKYYSNLNEVKLKVCLSDTRFSDFHGNVDNERKPCHLNVFSRGFDSNNIGFRGVIYNLGELEKQFSKNYSDESDVLKAAFEIWGSELNQHLIGDYVILFLSEKSLTVVSSSQSSYSLFYKHENGIKLSFDLEDFIEDEGVILDKDTIDRDCFCGVALQKNTYLDNTHQILPGESMVWRLEGNIELVENNKTNKFLFGTDSFLMKDIKPLSAQGFSSFSLFKNIPELTAYLKEPLYCTSLIEFDLLLAQQKSKFISIDQTWLRKREQSNLGIKKVLKMYGGLIGFQSRKRKKNIRAFRKYLELEFQQQTQQKLTNLDFEKWFDYKFILPRWIRTLQRIASRHNKHLLVPEGLIYGEVKYPIVKNKRTNNPAFNVADVSISNIFDATQRLMYNGERLTKKLFKVIPPVTASLIKQAEKHPRKVEGICLQLLTLDYLIRFFSYQKD